MWNESDDLSFLNWECDREHLDRPLAESEIDAVWQRFGLHAFKLAQTWVRRFGLLAHDSDAAEELLQETAVALVKSVRNGRIRASAGVIRSWLWITMRNLAIQNRRKRRGFLFAAECLSEEPAARETQQATRVEALQSECLEVKRQAQVAIAAVDEKHRQVFMLSIVEGLEPQEIAEVLAMNGNTVRTYLRRARRAAMHAIRDSAPARAAPDGDGISPGSQQRRIEKATGAGRTTLTVLLEYVSIFGWRQYQHVPVTPIVAEQLWEVSVHYARRRLASRGRSKAVLCCSKSLVTVRGQYVEHRQEHLHWWRRRARTNLVLRGSRRNELAGRRSVQDSLHARELARRKPGAVCHSTNRVLRCRRLANLHSD